MILPRRSFLALASGLLIPAEPVVERAYSFVGGWAKRVLMLDPHAPDGSCVCAWHREFDSVVDGGVELVSFPPGVKMSATFVRFGRQWFPYVISMIEPGIELS